MFIGKARAISRSPDLFGGFSSICRQWRADPARPGGVGVETSPARPCRSGAAWRGWRNVALEWLPKGEPRSCDGIIGGKPKVARDHRLPRRCIEWPEGGHRRAGRRRRSVSARYGYWRRRRPVSEVAALARRPNITAAAAVPLGGTGEKCRRWGRRSRSYCCLPARQENAAASG